MEIKRKKPITLLEIMIVIFLIGLIGSVIGYNMRGSLEEGKAFKTRHAQEQIKDILLLEIAKGEDIDTVIANPEVYLENSKLVKSVKDMLVDGWKAPFVISKNPHDANDIRVVSQNLINYEKKKKDAMKPDKVKLPVNPPPVEPPDPDNNPEGKVY
jgi:general secretion pathway protein G